MHKYTAPRWATLVDGLISYVLEDLFSMRRSIPLAWAINVHKIGTLFLILAMMFYYQNFTSAAWVYLALHGIYGYCWMVKDLGFRDGSFHTPITLLGGFLLYPMLVGWYWLLPWLFISKAMEPTGPQLFLAVAVHTLGITWMIAADCQKYFSLKYNRGLITDGVFKYTRNPNFLGEVMIYGAYALLVNHWLGYLVLSYALIYFYSRMLVKDASISRYPEWDEYVAQSSRLIPWKMLRPQRDSSL